MKFRKRSATNLPDKSALSAQLRTARDQIQRRQFSVALAGLNALLASGHLSGVAQGQILAFAGDSQFEQGKYADAVASYQQASTLVQGDRRAWLRPALGAVISLLRNAQPDTALAQARAMVQTALSLQSQYAMPAVPPSSRALVMARPWSPDAVATRLARQFLSEGELAATKTLLAQAQQINPLPTVYTCLLLAEVAEQEDRLTDAATFVRQSLAAGGYQAKTLSAWPLLLRINQRLGTPGVDAGLLANLAQAAPGVRARAMLLITKKLRSQNVSQWSQLAANWLSSAAAASQPSVTAEFKKLLLSTQRRQFGAPAAETAAAKQLLATPLVSPQEFVFAAKEQIRASCFAGSASPADWTPLVAQMVASYGVGFRAQITHALALAYMMGKRQDLARPVLQANIVATPATDPEWARSVSALARMEQFLGNHAAAAQQFLTLSQAPSVPARFQLYALLSWLRETLASGTALQVSAALALARPQLQNAITQLQDYTLLLDLGRQLSFAPAGVQDLAGTALDKGVQLAQTALAQAPNAEYAAVILAKLAQRQSDLGRYADVTTAWEALGSAKQAWLWTRKTEFWTYVALVFQAYERSGNGAAAQTLAATYINDPGTPPAAAPLIAVPYGLYQLHTGRNADALATFSWAVSQSPSTNVTAAAYYWLALAAWKAGNSAGAATLAGSLLLALKQQDGKVNDRQLEGKALLLQAGLNSANVSAQAVNFTAAALQQLAADIQVDLASLG